MFEVESADQDGNEMPSDWYPVGWLFFVAKGAPSRTHDAYWNPKHRKTTIADVAENPSATKLSRRQARKASAVEPKVPDEVTVTKNSSASISVMEEMAAAVTKESTFAKSREMVDWLRTELDNPRASEKYKRKLQKLLLAKEREMLLLMTDGNDTLSKLIMSDDEDESVNDD